MPHEFTLPADVADAKARMRAFIEKELAPWEAELDEGALISTELARKVRERSKELGFFAMTQGKHIGGTQASCLMLASLFELLASKRLRLGGYVWGPGEGFMGAIVREREKFPYLDEHYVTPLLAGEKTSAFGFTEPPNMARTTATLKTAQRTLTINGVKSYVSGGDRASFICVLANVLPGEGGASSGAKFGSTMVIIDKESPGVRIDRVFETISGHTAAYMVFENVVVPLDNVIGEIGKGLQTGLKQIGSVRLNLCATACGSALFAIDEARRTLNKPHRSGAPLAEKEGVQLRFADMLLQVQAARALLYQTAALVDERGRESAEVEQATMATKIFCTEMCAAVVDTSLQLCGGMALRVGHPLEQLYRACREWRFAEGASDLLRLKLARNALAPGGRAKSKEAKKKKTKSRL